MAELWQKSLERIQQRFVQLANGRKVASLLIETIFPVEQTQAEDEYRPEFLNGLKFCGLKAGHIYRNMQQIFGADGRPVPTDESLPPAPGRGAMTYNGVKYDVSPGSTRIAVFYGDGAVLDHYA